MAEIVRIRVPPGADWAEVTCYAARHLVSSLPRPLRSWDSTNKYWLVDRQLVSRLVSDLRCDGFEVLVDDQDQAADSWCDAMFAALPPDLADQCFRALTRILHPDVTGGDHKQMAALNAARDRSGGKQQQHR